MGVHCSYIHSRTIHCWTYLLISLVDHRRRDYLLIRAPVLLIYFPSLQNLRRFQGLLLRPYIQIQFSTLVCHYNCLIEVDCVHLFILKKRKKEKILAPVGWAFVSLQFLPLVPVSICFIFETVDARSRLLFFLFSYSFPSQ